MIYSASIIISVTMLEKIRTVLQNKCLIASDQLLIVGVSGGPDSLCLLDVLVHLDYNIIIAHFDHCLRSESRAEAQAVKKTAEDMGIPFLLGQKNVVRYAETHRLSVEEASRVARYEFIFQQAERHGVQAVAIGHNADDQVETVLMRFLRGSGLEGLMGIPPVRGKIIRPLIECSRAEIEEYCKENKIGYRVDSSNKEVVYFRNKIRLELLPLLSKDYNKNIKDIMLRLRSIISEVSAYLNQETELLFKEVARRESPEMVIIDLKKFTSLPLALKRRIIRKSIEVVKGNLYSISFRHNNEILKLTEYQLGEKEIYLPDNLMAKKIYNKIMIYKKRISKDQTEEIPTPWKYDILIPGKTEIKSLGIKVEIKILDSADIKSSLYLNRKKSKGEFLEFIDYNKVKLPLKLRNRRSGDRFYPLKMKGLKKVKDFFIDNKIPKGYRDLIPILLDSEDKIIWIMGMRLDDRVKINSDTKKVLCIKTKIKNIFLQEYF